MYGDKVMLLNNFIIEKRNAMKKKNVAKKLKNLMR
jgi:hypothetical protein